jgi:hypothetical protein
MGRCRTVSGWHDRPVSRSLVKHSRCAQVEPDASSGITLPALAELLSNTQPCRNATLLYDEPDPAGAAANVRLTVHHGCCRLRQHNSVCLDREQSV